MAAIWHRALHSSKPAVCWRDIEDLSLVAPEDLGIRIINNTAMEEVLPMVHQAMEKQEYSSFAVFDMGFVAERYMLWKTCFPDTRPFYAMKAYDDPAVVSLLTYLGAGFDCSSETEMQVALKSGVNPSNIVFSNTNKFPAHIKYASNKGIKVMTFDNKDELIKIKQIAPTASLVLRITPKEYNIAEWELSSRFGCDKKDVPQLLQDAQNLGLKVVGVSFHVGSGIKDPEAYIGNIKLARYVFDVAKQMGFDMSLLDIGGGFCGDMGADILLKKMCDPINETLRTLFPKESGVQVISEPGRYFVEGALTLLSCVIGKKIGHMNPPVPVSTDQVEGNCVKQAQSFLYTISESKYGTLFLGHYPPHESELIPVPSKPNHKTYMSKVCGPTCDSYDVIAENCYLPELQIGDWLMTPNVGHYAVPLASSFNGIPLCPIRRVMHKDLFDKISSEYQQD